MRGSLAETSVADLCRRLADAGATGTLVIEHPAGQGRLAFVDGRLSWAEPPSTQARLGDRLVHAGLLSRQDLEAALTEQRERPVPPPLGAVLVERGATSRDSVRVYVQEQILDALVELSLRSEGAYHFVSGTSPGEELPADLAVGDALAAVARRQEQWERIRAAIPDLDVVPYVSGQAPTSAERLEPDDVALLEAVDGRRSVRDLAAALGYGSHETLRILHGLHLLGMLETRAPSPRPEPAVDLDDEEFARLLETLDEDEPGGSDPVGSPASGSEAPEQPDERPATVDGREEPPADVPPPATDEPAVPADDPAPISASEEEPPAERQPRRSGDVAEFLRELSQLAVDEDDR